MRLFRLLKGNLIMHNWHSLTNMNGWMNRIITVTETMLPQRPQKTGQIAKTVLVNSLGPVAKYSLTLKRYNLSSTRHWFLCSKYVRYLEVKTACTLLTRRWMHLDPIDVYKKCTMSVFLNFCLVLLEQL